jgi:hypothetical protein
MKTLDEIREQCIKNETSSSNITQPYSAEALEKIFKKRVMKHTNKAMKYFWASFTLQIMVYGLFSHVILRFWMDVPIMLLGFAGILLFIPFTVMLMRKFKAIAKASMTRGTGTDNLHDYVLQQHTLLQSFYTFKKRYELILIPLASAIGTILTFQLFVPGGALENINGVLIAFGLTIFSCFLAIISENKKSFDQTLQQLKEILNEFKSEE